MDEQEPRVPPDPSGIEEPHDVLAAEEFGIGTRDERYPADPTGIEQPHDVLAAEEFAMPAPDAPVRPSQTLRAAVPRALAALVVLAIIALVVLRRRG
ncbi:MAG: hypothetical protein ICV69_15595 [Thermoleophilaceae bacterium]|nr:hypothetical protein [Thermoleophilaceae bacterium]